MNANTRSFVSLVPTVLLCLPSFAGALTFFANALLKRQITDWGTTSSVFVASAVFFGWPLVAVAAVVGALIGLSHAVSQRVKYAHYIIVTVATLLTFALTFRFGM